MKQQHNKMQKMQKVEMQSAALSNENEHDPLPS